VGDTPDLVRLDAIELSELIRTRAVSCAEVMRAYLDHIAVYNPRVNAIVALRDRDELLAEAAERDRDLAAGRYHGWMHGMPHAVKDLAAARGLPWTNGSPIFADQVADTDDTFVARIRAAGAIIIGKTNVPEFGLGSQSYNSVYGTTTNPYDTTRTAGGSSGGAGASLALRMLPVADGGDYMGSLRNPAAFNNVYGLRPSFGRVPTPGFVQQLAVLGPMGRTVDDVAALLRVMAGPDDAAPLSNREDPARFAPPVTPRDLRGARIAWVGDWDGYLATEPGVLDVCASALPVFESLGARVDPVRPAFAPERIWQAFLTWRWWANLGRHGLYADPALRRQVKPEALWEIEQGLKVTALDITRAMGERDAWYAAVLEMFETYDYILALSAQVFPFDAATHWPREIAGREMDTYHRWMETVAPWSMTGLPALGMPAGLGPSGLPMGVTLIGRPAADLSVLSAAKAYEQATHVVRDNPPPMLG
jgi:amidase